MYGGIINAFQNTGKANNTGVLVGISFNSILLSYKQNKTDINNYHSNSNTINSNFNYLYTQYNIYSIGYIFFKESEHNICTTISIIYLYDVYNYYTKYGIDFYKEFSLGVIYIYKPESYKYSLFVELNMAYIGFGMSYNFSL
jgi:hypothetical protein